MTDARLPAFDDLYRIPFVEDAQISPDGRRVAFVLRRADRAADENRSWIWVVEDGGEPRQFTAGPADHSPRWSPDGRWLAFVGKRPGERPGADAPQLQLLPADGGEAQTLTTMRAGAGNPLWSPDGTRLAFLSAQPIDGWPEEERPAAAPVVIRRIGFKADGSGLLGDMRSHLFVIAVGSETSGEAVQLTSGDAAIGTPAWSPDGLRLAFAGSFADDRDLTMIANIFSVDAKGGDIRPVTDRPGSAAAPLYTAGGDDIVFAGSPRIESGHTELWRVPADGGPIEPLVEGLDRNVMLGAPAYPGALPRLMPDGKTVVFAARDGGVTHLYTVDAGGGRATKFVGEAQTSCAGLSVADDGTLATVESGPSTCGEVLVVRTGNVAGDRWTSLVSDALADVEVPVRERRTFVAPDGTEIEGWVLRRAGAQAGHVPLLLDIHGGPHNAWTPTFDTSHLYHYALAAAGWAVLTINPRGSDGYGKGFYTGLDPVGWGIADIGDFLAAVDALVADGTADPERLAVTGYSYGGFMTNVLTARTNRFRVAVSGGSIADQISTAGTSDLGYFIARVAQGTVPWEDWDRLVVLSPLRDVGNVTAPTLILHGEADDRCPVSQAEEWFTALRARGVETEMVRYPGSSHLFVAMGRPSHRIDYNRRVVEWVTRHIGG